MILCEAVPRIRIECAPSRALVHSYSAVSKIKCLNSGARRCTMFLSVAAFSGAHTIEKQRQLLLSFSFRRHDGASMTEHEDQIAQYLKLEETAALVARIRHEINNPLTGVLGQPPCCEKT